MVDIVLAALAAGAGAGVSDTASQVIKDAYASFKARVGLVLAGRGPEVEELAEHPVERAAELREALLAARADADPELVAAARQVLEAVGTELGATAKYAVDIRDSTGVQIGDNATMNLHITR
ncbi:hypothetical protein AB0A74_01920 [Saccharothrix sp. NPDC042600]|uniref:hypothetical protein n=1 Tax=Saccharothrix TaxID=2071 RepID=UPI0033D2297E